MGNVFLDPYNCDEVDSVSFSLSDRGYVVFLYPVKFLLPQYCLQSVVLSLNIGIFIEKRDFFAHVIFYLFDHVLLYITGGIFVKGGDY